MFTQEQLEQTVFVAVAEWDLDFTWIYAMQPDKTPKPRHVVKGHNHYAFSGVRRHIAEAIMRKFFGAVCSHERKSIVNSVVAALMRIAA